MIIKLNSKYMAQVFNLIFSCITYSSLHDSLDHNQIKKGLGPRGTVEISSSVKSLRWVRAMNENENTSFIYDPSVEKIYLSQNKNDTLSSGHLRLFHITGLANPYGGNIRRYRGELRTDENSGHYGAKWHDLIRFRFIRLMQILDLSILHEPWVQDEVVLKERPILYRKKLHNELFDENDYKQLNDIARYDFSNLSNIELIKYQNKFIQNFNKNSPTK